MNRLIFAALTLTLAACASTDTGRDTDGATRAADTGRATDTYVLTTCPVSGEPLPDEGAVTATVDGHETRFCCGNCASMAEGDPATWGPLIEEALIEAQLEDYPLTTCAVMPSSALGSMGEPHDMLVGDTLVRLCCAGCANAVKDDPERYVAIVAAARGE